MLSTEKGKGCLKNGNGNALEAVVIPRNVTSVYGERGDAGQCTALMVG